jgi:hypothetical protein
MNIYYHLYTVALAVQYNKVDVTADATECIW